MIVPTDGSVFEFQSELTTANRILFHYGVVDAMKRLWQPMPPIPGKYLALGIFGSHKSNFDSEHFKD